MEYQHLTTACEVLAPERPIRKSCVIPTTEGIVDALIRLTFATKLDRMIVAGPKCVETLLELHRRGFRPRPPSAANHYRFARSHFSAANDYLFKQTIKRFKAGVPPDAFGSLGYRAGTPFGRSSIDVWSGVYFVGRDPDPNIRFQLLRDFR